MSVCVTQVLVKPYFLAVLAGRWSHEVLRGLPWNFAGTFTVPGWRIPMTLLIPWHFLKRKHEVDICWVYWNVSTTIIWVVMFNFVLTFIPNKRPLLSFRLSRQCWSKMKLTEHWGNWQTCKSQREFHHHFWLLLWLSAICVHVYFFSNSSLSSLISRLCVQLSDSNHKA